MQGISFLANVGWILIICAIIFLFFPKTRKIGLAVACALIFSLIICNVTIKPIIARIRPYDLREGIELIIARPTDFSFPSGHTSISFAGAIPMLMYNKKIGIPALLLAIIIAFSRLYLYVHFPTDVLGGMIVGSICGVLGYFTSKFIYKRFIKKEVA
jgi:undecaprenyl-diphosphatase